MKVRAPSADSRYFDVKKLIHGASLNTICEEARCPNIAECWGRGTATFQIRSEEHTSELQSRVELVCRLLLEKKNEPAYDDSFCDQNKKRARLFGFADADAERDRCGNAKLAKHPDHFFFFNDTATTEIYTLSLHDALPI